MLPPRWVVWAARRAFPARHSLSSSLLPAIHLPPPKGKEKEEEKAAPLSLTVTVSVSPRARGNLSESKPAIRSERSTPLPNLLAISSLLVWRSVSTPTRPFPPEEAARAWGARQGRQWRRRTMGGEGRGGGCRPGERGRERGEKGASLVSTARCGAREGRDGGRRHSATHRGEQGQARRREESDVGVLVLCGLPPSLRRGTGTGGG